MAKIYLIRHAESVANTQGRYQGQSFDTPLSPLGKKQILALQKRFGKTKFDTVFSSPLLRTMTTAEALGKPVLEKDILETNHGDWEGKTKIEIARKWPDLYSLWLKRPSKVVFPNGESFIQTFQRAVCWINKLENQKGTFAVVTHANIIRCSLNTSQLVARMKPNREDIRVSKGYPAVYRGEDVISAVLTHFLSRDLDKMWEFKIQPTSVSLIQVNSGKRKIKYYNDSSHLDGLASDLSVQAI